jgi:hypothetical protein
MYLLQWSSDGAAWSSLEQLGAGWSTMEQLMEHYGALMEHYGALLEHWSSNGALGTAMEH